MRPSQLGAHAFGEVVDLARRARLVEAVADDLELGHRAGGAGRFASWLGKVPDVDQAKSAHKRWTEPTMV